MRKTVTLSANCKTLQGAKVKLFYIKEFQKIEEFFGITIFDIFGSLVNKEIKIPWECIEWFMYEWLGKDAEDFYPFYDIVTAFWEVFSQSGRLPDGTKDSGFTDGSA